ncbi:PREDICTED: quinolinate synthase, chloroplastic-like [Camelina sativa]|uniref:quinolinate synthase n=1 Tax=Camelina sativa TaxID=90675 RepID=A0ABM0UIP7_CAMSA|nr:PREDICTED: quinolinate synthase, chloroplastic-like [Camelina sativa]
MASTLSIAPTSSSHLSLNPNASPNFRTTHLNFGSQRRIHNTSPLFRSFKCLKSSSKDVNASPFSISAIASSSQTTELVPEKLQRLVKEFKSFTEPIDRLKWVLHYGSVIPPMPESSRTESNRVMGCTARVWLDAELGSDGKMRFWADSDSDVSKGMCSCLIQILDEASPEEVMELKIEDLAELNVGLLGVERSRVNTWHNVLVSMQKKTRRLVAEREGKVPSFEPFPSLVLTADGVEAKGSFAEAQAKYLFPEESRVQELVNVLKEKKIGVVAHFYMDPEVQGVLTAAQKHWPHISISDSLVMADSAVSMAKAGCQFVTVLGVDFMSENVRAILDQAGFGEVGVYRMSDETIGCSLADAASAPAYLNYLEAASLSPPSLHVVYINTSLETKAFAHELVPTITCTSSNVVQTILQAFAQMPDLNVWYGPDSYMGANIVKLFQQMTVMTDEEIAKIHPKHSLSTIKSLLPRLHYFQEGTCIVHHLFGHEVVERLKYMYCDAFLTAHLEVPGEMFSLAMEAKKRDMGVVGSTQNILDFIKQKVQEAVDRNVDDHLQFVLGTESGMVTAIVAVIRSLLRSSANSKVKVEVVFPVSSDSMTKTTSDSSNSTKVGDVALPVVPGVAGGEGCSIHGGCASCPYMKMNSLSSLLKVCHNLPDVENIFGGFIAERFKKQTPQGKLIADVGCEPILHMRHFQANKELPEKLVHQVLSWEGKR